MKITVLKARPQWANRFTVPVIAGALLLAAAPSARAQQDPGAPMDGGPGQGGQNQGGNGRGNFQNMTPEQRQQLQAQMEARRNTQRQEWLRQAMTASGLTDVVMQNAVINYMMAQEKSRVTLQDQARALSNSLIKPETEPETLKIDLAAYRAAVAAANKQSAADLTALDAQVKYSTNPRIETLLTLLGVLGNETTQLGGIGAIFPDSPYGNRGGGRGGRGQGGRGQGGQGGQGGGQMGGG